MRKGDDAKAHKELNALGGDGGGEKEMDTGKAQDALAQLESAAAAEKAARLERERELAKVKIDSKDVKLIMDGTCIAVRCVRLCSANKHWGFPPAECHSSSGPTAFARVASEAPKGGAAPSLASD